jgi:pimeloyl-ACP methyl ester carboxylesterase
MPTVVFVHGLIGPFALDALDDATIVAPDLHGYGTTQAGGEITIDRQADALARAIEPYARVHLVAHSVGGVIAASYAHRHPHRVASLTSVEGNFTLNDAFWSRELAAKPPHEVHELLERDRSDPARWLNDAGVEPTAERVTAAAEALAFQRATTVQAMARAVVDYTGRSTYEPMLRDVFKTVPVHLIAGARSRAGWDVPAWALEAAASYAEIPDAGHMVMLEAPEGFAAQLRRVVYDA